MDLLQNGEILGMAAKGTRGELARLDGSDLEAGIHLRWQMAQELGFPPGGFDLYRREENYSQFLRCGHLIEADVVGVRWVPYRVEHAGVEFTITFNREVEFTLGCGPAGFMAAAFPGPQEVRLDFEQPVRAVRITFDGFSPHTPAAEAYWQARGGPVLVGRRRAQRQNSERTITLFGDRIDTVVLKGEDMLICEVCFVLVRDGYHLGWPQIQLNGGDPIYMPVTHPEWNPAPPWRNDAAEAGARLPGGLPTPKRVSYSQGFRDELHAILYDLAGAQPQSLHRLQEGDLDSAAMVDWPGLSLLQLMAVDPNIARILGLYWHDVPPRPNRYYDYRLVAHYADQPFPGRQIDFNKLAPGARLGSRLEIQGLAFTSPNPIDVVRESWNGSEHTGLLFTRDILTAPITIGLPQPAKSVTLRWKAADPVTIKYYLGYKEQHMEIKPAGEISATYEDKNGISQILLLAGGELTLVHVILRQAVGGLGDLIYDVYHVRASGDEPLPAPDLDPPLVLPSATGLDEDGGLMAHQSRVGLRWEQADAGGGFLRAGAPVQYQIRREDLAEDEVTVLRQTILNENAPILISGLGDTNGAQPLYSDRSVPDGAYTYAIRGIDIFGVLGEWSATQRVDVEDRHPPPPPQSLQADYLDPANPWLSVEDQIRVDEYGPGLKLSWTWPGIFQLQAPDVAPPFGEFRVYGVEGDLNRLDGNVTEISTGSGTASLSTDIEFPGPAGALAGEAIRVGQNFFQVTGNTHGPDCQIEIQILSSPELAPSPGPCSMTFSRGRSYWRDYSRAASWERRLHIHPAGPAGDLSAEVAGIADFIEGEAGQEIAKPGAERTVILNAGLDDAENVLLPGALLCGGVVYPAYGHTLGSALEVHIVPALAPGNSLAKIEPAPGAACIYYPGRRYQLYLPDYRLAIPPGQASVRAQVAVSASDGKGHISDDPIWSRSRRGGLGRRSGNESALSIPVTVQAVQRALPLPLPSVPVLPETPIYARPANYFGQAHYTLTWDAAPGAAGYVVYRCSGAALFDHDRGLRQGQQAPYDTGRVFSDDPGFAAWLADFDPTLTEAEMVADPEGRRDAWRAWAGRFYPQLGEAQIQALASLAGNQSAFRRLNPEAITEPSYEDSFDGRGQGMYLYRVRTMDAASNTSEWSATFPPVHIFDVTPPATPVVTSVLGGEKRASLRWRANTEEDLAGYRLWVSANAEDLANVRRIPPDHLLNPTVGEVDEVHMEMNLAGPKTYYFRLAAEDANGNVSEPTPILAARAVDTSPPEPPLWTLVAWRADATGIELEWQLAEPSQEVLVQRSEAGSSIWIPISAWLPAGAQSFLDAQVRSTREYSYRLLVRAVSGLLNEQFSIQTVPALLL